MTILSPILRSRYIILRKTPILKVLLTFLLLFALLPASAIKKIEANPICIAAMLTEQPDSASVASTCVFYGYQPHGNKDGYSVFIHSNGCVVRFKYTTATDGKKYSTIEIISKASPKDRDRILKNLRFQKVGNSYERRSIAHQTSCIPGSNSTLIFCQQPKSKKL